MSDSGLPGNLVELYLAGITQIIFLVVGLMLMPPEYLAVVLSYLRPLYNSPASIALTTLQ